MRTLVTGTFPSSSFASFHLLSLEEAQPHQPHQPEAIPWGKHITSGIIIFDSGRSSDLAHPIRDRSCAYNCRLKQHQALLFRPWYVHLSSPSHLSRPLSYMKCSPSISHALFGNLLRVRLMRLLRHVHPPSSCYVAMVAIVMVGTNLLYEGIC